MVAILPEVWRVMRGSGGRVMAVVVGRGRGVFEVSLGVGWIGVREGWV